jgi:hypothetical protein
MSSADSSDPSSKLNESGSWRRVKRALRGTGAIFALFKNVALLGFFGALIAAYVQYRLSAYQENVSTQAKEDLAAATQTFVETANALSSPITLQGLLLQEFAHATKLNTVTDQTALATRYAADLYKPYEDAYASLLENVNVFARKAEIYLDWSADLASNPMVIEHAGIGNDPISMLTLGAYNFDCDNDMPSFAPDKTQVLLKGQDGGGLYVDWYSAKHHLLTAAYCLSIAHDTWMEIVRQWASHGSLAADDVTKFFGANKPDQLQARVDNEVVRLNTFMDLAMNKINGIRVKYQLNGAVCGVLFSRCR